MEKEFKDIINKIPSNWDELKFKQFRQLIQIPVTETTDFDNLYVGIDNTTKTLSVLTGLEIEEIETLPLYVVNQMANKIAFITKEPDASKLKSSIKWKGINEITYDNYITFHTLIQTNPFDNLGMLLSAFSLTPIKEEDVDNLPTSEVLSAFFLLNRVVKKYLKSSIRKESSKLTRLMFKQALQTLFKRRIRK